MDTASSRHRRPLPTRLALVLGAAVAAAACSGAVRAQESGPPEPEGPPAVLFTVPEAPASGAEAPDASVPTRPGALVAQQTGFLGVAIEDLSAEEARELGLSETGGVRIQEVVEESPAAEAGLRDGDVLVRWRGETVVSVAQLRRLVRETPPGRTVAVAYLRDGQRGETEVTVSERSPFTGTVSPLDEEARLELREHMEEARRAREEAMAESREAREEALERAREAREEWREQAEALRGELGAREWEWRTPGPGTVHVFARTGPRIGVHLLSLTDQLAGYFGLESRTGALVASVEEDSPAREAGLAAGDVILAIDGQEVESPGEASRLIRASAGEEAEVRILRRGERRTLSVQVPEEAASAGLMGPDDQDRRRVRVRRLAPRLESRLEVLRPRLRRLAPEIRGSLEEIAPRLRRLEPLLRRSLVQRMIIV